MLGATDLIKIIQKTASATIESGSPCNIVFGTVATIEPLTIMTDQKITLNDKQLVLARNCTEFNLEMSVDHETEDFVYEKEHSHTGTSADGGSISISSYTEQGEHTHDYQGRKVFTVHNALIVGEKVILVQMSGGQRFIVVDRIG